MVLCSLVQNHQWINKQMGWIQHLINPFRGRLSNFNPMRYMQHLGLWHLPYGNISTTSRQYLKDQKRRKRIRSTKYLFTVPTELQSFLEEHVMLHIFCAFTYKYVAHIAKQFNTSGSKGVCTLVREPGGSLKYFLTTCNRHSNISFHVDTHTLQKEYTNIKLTRKMGCESLLQAQK